MLTSGEGKGLALVAVTAADYDRAALLSVHLKLPLLQVGTDPRCCKQASAVLLVAGRGLCVQQTGDAAAGPVTVDFGNARMRHRRRGGSAELLGRAVGRGKARALRVMDATAGLGRDAFVLADLGAQLQLVERDPIIAALLHAGLELARCHADPWVRQVAGRMTLHAGDVRQLAPERMQKIDVIYLDPMFPQRTKRAAVKKEMALLQFLLRRDSILQDADVLLPWAIAQDVARVVVKRPAKASNLGMLPPSHSIDGRTVRYDVYVSGRLP